MVGIVLVSHSYPLALAVQGLVHAMTGPDLPLAIAAGAGDDHSDLGTNAVEIMEAVGSVISNEGVLVLMDMGSALLSTDTALEFLDEADRSRVRCCAAPFVEGAIAAGVVAVAGGKIDDVAREANGSLQQKAQHLGENSEMQPSVHPATSALDHGVRVTIREPHGLHARPAARFVRDVAAHNAEVAVRNLTRGRGPASGKSITGLASLEILCGDEIEISAAGPDAESVLQSLVSLVESFGDEAPVPERIAGVAAAPPTLRDRAIPISSGIVIGQLFEPIHTELRVPESQAADIVAEQSRLRLAIQTAQAALTRDAAAVPAAEAEIFDAQKLVLDDPALVDVAENFIQSQNLNAAASFHRAFVTVADNYRRLTDEYQRQRAADIEDAGLRVLQALGLETGSNVHIPESGILFVNDLKPGEVSQIDKNLVLGVVTRGGGKTSHAAILLRALGIPSVAGAEHLLPASVPNGTCVAFDGDTGELWMDPNAEIVGKLRSRFDQQKADAEVAEASRHATAVTRDGKTIAVLANLGDPSEAAYAVEQGAEGIGLFRTEFLFLDRRTPPDEEEQTAALRVLARAMGQRPVTIRTLDAGGDKDLPYLGSPPEDNPFLGVRAIRLCLRRLEIFRPQLRAILRAGIGANFRIMFPMVTEPSELISAQEELTRVHEDLASQNIPHVWPIPTGIMVEVPSTVTLMDQFLPLADFFSIGTNDLTQYILAADRGNPALAQFQDALHPAVLRMIRHIAITASSQGKHVCVCGEAAGDPTAARLLVGLGVDELSVTSSLVPRIKATVRDALLADSEVWAQQMVRLGSAGEVREAANR